MTPNRANWLWMKAIALTLMCFGLSVPIEERGRLSVPVAGQEKNAQTDAPKLPTGIRSEEVYRRVKDIAEKWLRPWWPAPNQIWETPWNREEALKEFTRLQQQVQNLENVQQVLPRVIGGQRSRMFDRWEQLKVNGREIGWDTDAGNPACAGPEREVVLGTGELILARVDISLPFRGGIGFSMVRYYRSHVDYDGPLGPGWDHSCNQRVLGYQQNGQLNCLEWLTGRRAIRFNFAQGDWTPEPGAFYRLQFQGKSIFIERADGVRLEFEPAVNQPVGAPLRWRIARIASRHDQWKANQLRFHYRPGADLLEMIEDPFGNKVRFYHDQNGRLRAVRVGEALLVRYDYDPVGRLTKVTFPKVALSPAQAQDVSWEYRYAGGNRNWLEVEIQPGEQMEKLFIHEVRPNFPDYGRVTEVRLRGKDKTEAVWKFQAQRGKNTCIVSCQPPEPLPREEWTFELDQHGRTSCYPQSRTVLPRQAQWQWKHNSDGLLVEERRPLGGRTVWVYDSNNKDSRFRGNLLQKEESVRPGINPLPITKRGWRWKYHPEIALAVEAVAYETDHQGRERVLQTSCFEYDQQDKELVREQTGVNVLWTVRNRYGLPVVEWDGRGCARVYRYYSLFQQGQIAAEYGGLLAEQVEDAAPNIVDRVLQEVRKPRPNGIPQRQAEGAYCQRLSRFRYDPYGRVSAEEYPGHQVVRLWNKLGQRLSVLDTRTDLIVFAYDEALRCSERWQRVQVLKEAQFAGEKWNGISGVFTVERMRYDSLGRLVAWYPTSERLGVEKKVIPENRYEYLPSGLLRKRITSAGAAVEMIYDPVKGELRSIRLLSRNSEQQPLTLRDKMEYDSEGFLLSYTDAKSEIYRAEPDGFGRAFATIRPDGLRKELVRDGLDRAVREQAFDAHHQLLYERAYEYDTSGRLVKVSHRRLGENQLGIRQRVDEWLTAAEMSYDPEGNIVARRDWRQASWEKFGYDGLGRLVWHELPEGDRHETVYENDWIVVETQRLCTTTEPRKTLTLHTVTLRDNRGQPWCSIPVGHDGTVGIRRAALLHFDSSGNAAYTAFLGSKQIYRFYNTLGLLEKEVVRDSRNQILSQTENRYDVDGLLLEHEIHNEPLVFRQKQAGNVTFDRQKIPQLRRLEYDGYRRLRKETSPDGLVSEYEYGPDSRVSTLVRYHILAQNDKEILAFDYDQLGRLHKLSEKKPNNRELQRFHYDWQGNVVKAWDFAQPDWPLEVRRHYDNLGLLLSEQIRVDGRDLPCLVYDYDLIRGVQTVQVCGLVGQPMGWSKLKLQQDCNGRVRMIEKDDKEFCHFSYVGMQEIARVFPLHNLKEQITELDPFLEPLNQQLCQTNKANHRISVYEICYQRDDWSRITCSSMRVYPKQWELSYFCDRDPSDNLTAEAMEARFYEPQRLAERRRELLLLNKPAKGGIPIAAYLTRRRQYDHAGNVMAIYRGPADTLWPEGTELASASEPLVANVAVGIARQGWNAIQKAAVQKQEFDLASNRIATKALVFETRGPSQGDAIITTCYKYDNLGRLVQYVSSATGRPVRWDIRYDVLGRIIAMDGFDANIQGNKAQPSYQLQFAYDPFNRRIVKHVKQAAGAGAEEKSEVMLYTGQSLTLKLRRSTDQKQPWVLQGQYIAGTEPSKILAYYERTRTAAGQPAIQEYLLHQDAARNIVLSSGYDHQGNLEVFDIASYWGWGENSTTGHICGLSSSLVEEKGREEHFARDKVVDDKTASWFGNKEPGYLTIKLAQKHKLQSLEAWAEKLPDKIRIYVVDAGKAPGKHDILPQWEKQHAHEKVFDFSQRNDQNMAKGPAWPVTFPLGGRQGEEIVLVWDSCPEGISVREFHVFVNPVHPGDLAFSGVVYDFETGLYCHGARYRLPELGIFISPDPLGFLAGDNLYAFAHNDPLTWHDPDGHYAHLLLGAVTGSLFGAGIYIWEWWRYGEEWSWERFGTHVLAGTLSGTVAAAVGPAGLSLVSGWMGEVLAGTMAGALSGATHGLVSTGVLTYLETGDLRASLSAGGQAAIRGALWGSAGGAIGGAIAGPLARNLHKFIENEFLRGLATSTLTGAGVGAGVGAVRGAFAGYGESGWEGVLSGAVSGAWKGALAGSLGGLAAFGVGKAMDKVMKVTWDKSRAKYWREEAKRNPDAYSPENLERMHQGLAPQRINPKTGQLESMELHHAYLPQRSGLPRSLIDSRWNLKKVWPEEHKAIDPYR